MSSNKGRHLKRQDSVAKRPSVSKRTNGNMQPSRNAHGPSSSKRAKNGNVSSTSSRARKAASQPDARSRSQSRRNDSTRRAATQTRGSVNAGKEKSPIGKIRTSKPVLISLIVVALLLGGGVWDLVSNWGKAYGNISINGIAVSGMNDQQMQEELRSTFGPRVAHAQVTIYANEEALAKGRSTIEELEAAAIADQVSYEESISSSEWWQTDALSLKATIPYVDAIEQALALGRDDGGFAKRFDLMFNPVDIQMDVNFDAEALDHLASEIDGIVGDERQDASVYVEGNNARAVEGHDGLMVDRAWLGEKISDAMIRENVPDSFAAEVSPAKSRITMEQAEEMAEVVNRAINTKAVFTYNGKSWTASDTELGNWTVVKTVEDGDSFKLEPSINSELAMPGVVKGTGASITNGDTTVTFEHAGDDILVKTSGDGDIPEALSAVEQLDDIMYGPDGIAWKGGTPDPISIEIGETEMPEELSFSDAVDMGIVTAIGEYTTEFSNYEGTENRNHNIKLASDILNNGIIEADGGIWDFNTESGDTNEDAGFWSAGSIVDGEYQDSIGGGICQVATTIFNAVYEGGLKVVERHNHSLYIASYPTGRDASVSYPDLNFSWKNTLDSDILMQITYTDTSITVKLYSVYTGYSAETETGEWEEGEKYKTRFETDDSLAEGAYYLKTSGEDGSKITVTRTVYDDAGKQVFTDSFGSVYEAKDEVYLIGPGTDTSGLTRSTDSSSSSSASASSDNNDGYGDEIYGEYV